MMLLKWNAFYIQLQENSDIQIQINQFQFQEMEKFWLKLNVLHWILVIFTSYKEITMEHMNIPLLQEVREVVQ